MTADVAERLWNLRARALRVALDSYRRRGQSTVWSKDLAKVLDIPESAVRRMGLSMIGRCQIQGAVVRYAVGLWMIDPKGRG